MMNMEDQAINVPALGFTRHVMGREAVHRPTADQKYHVHCPCPEDESQHIVHYLPQITVISLIIVPIRPAGNYSSGTNWQNNQFLLAAIRKGHLLSIEYLLGHWPLFNALKHVA